MTPEYLPEPEKPAKKKPNTRSHLNRILIALAKIYEDDGASIPERLQATRLASEVLERRPVPRRKTEKEKLVEAALGHQRKPFGGKPIKKTTDPVSPK